MKAKQWSNELLLLLDTSMHPTSHSLLLEFVSAGSLDKIQVTTFFAQAVAGLGPTTATDRLCSTALLSCEPEPERTAVLENIHTAPAVLSAHAAVEDSSRCPTMPPLPTRSC